MVVPVICPVVVEKSNPQASVGVIEYDVGELVHPVRELVTLAPKPYERVAVP